MDQATTKTYLRNVLDDNNRNASLGQCLNDVFNGAGKATGNYVFTNLPVWHASSGSIGAANGVTLFWTMNGTVASIFAMGDIAGRPRIESMSMVSLEHLSHWAPPSICEIDQRRGAVIRWRARQNEAGLKNRTVCSTDHDLKKDATNTILN